MSLLVTLNGVNYIIPETNEVGWGSNLDAYFVAIAAGCLQKTGGAFTLSAETDFGSSFGLKSLYYKSRASNVASTGALRLANAETGVVWRNFLNNADLPLTVNASNQLTFNGTAIGGSGIYTVSRAIVSDGSGNLTAATTTSTEIGYVNGVTSSIQTQINTKKTITTGNAYKWETTDVSGSLQETTITASKAIASDANGLPTASTTTATELGHVAGVTSAIQTQINTKSPSASPTFTGIVTIPVGGESAPSLTFTANTSDGLFRTASRGGGVGVTVGGSERAAFGAGQFAIGDGAAGTLSSNGAQLGLTFGSTILYLDSSHINATTALTITPTSNQLILGATRTITLTAPTPATSSRIWTIPDISADATFCALEGTQTISGTKTFSSTIDSSTATILSSSQSSSSNIGMNIQNTGSGGVQLLLGHGVNDTSDVWIEMFATTTPTYWSMGIDQSDSSKWKLSQASTLGTNDALTFNTSLQIANNLTLASGKTLSLIDDSTHTVSLKATASTTSYTFSLPTTGGTNGYFLTTDGSGNSSWTAPTGTGTVNAGTTPLLAYYKTTTNAVSNVDADASMGTHKITSLANATLAQDASAYTQVKVLDKYTASNQVEVSSTSASYADTGLTVTLTPKSAGNLFIIIATLNTRIRVNTQTDCTGSLRLLGTTNGTLVSDVRVAYVSGASETKSFYNQQTITYIDAPATVSAQTYKVQMARSSGGGTFYTSDGNTTPSQITVFEINSL